MITICTAQQVNNKEGGEEEKVISESLNSFSWDISKFSVEKQPYFDFVPLTSGLIIPFVAYPQFSHYFWSLLLSNFWICWHFFSYNWRIENKLNSSNILI